MPKREEASHQFPREFQKNIIFDKTVLVFPIICFYNMRQYATFHEKKYGSKPTIYDIECKVVYSEYTTYDMSHMRFYATCRSFSHRIGRVAGV